MILVGDGVSRYCQSATWAAGCITALIARQKAAKSSYLSLTHMRMVNRGVTRFFRFAHHLENTLKSGLMAETFGKRLHERGITWSLYSFNWPLPAFGPFDFAWSAVKYCDAVHLLRSFPTVATATGVKLRCAGSPGVPISRVGRADMDSSGETADDGRDSVCRRATADRMTCEKKQVVDGPDGTRVRFSHSHLPSSSSLLR